MLSTLDTGPSKVAARDRHPCSHSACWTVRATTRSLVTFVTTMRYDHALQQWLRTFAAKPNWRILSIIVSKEVERIRLAYDQWKEPNFSAALTVDGDPLSG